MTENDMTGLLLKLADLGVTGIKIIYSGGGDSGAIDDVVYTTEKISNDEYGFMRIEDIPNWGENVLYVKDLDSDLCDTIESFAEEKILNDVEDWWNNDGGHGAMLIKVPSGEYKIENNIYITNTETYNHDGNLLEKTSNYE
jgi:hypothetical protein